MEFAVRKKTPPADMLPVVKLSEFLLAGSRNSTVAGRPRLNLS
jgi:hypothetical protein